MKLDLNKERWELAEPFSISGRTMTFAEIVVVELREGEYMGRGEANPFQRYNQTGDSVVTDIEKVRSKIEAGLSFDELQLLLPAGSARNAVDCALWDLRAKQSGKRIWELADIPKPRPLMGNITIGLDEPDVMKDKAESYANAFGMLKVKLGKQQPIECLAAVRDGAPSARLLVDANEAWEFEELKDYAPRLQAMGVELIEQPMLRGEDKDLLNYDCPLPLAADESCFDRSDLDYLKGRYDFINMKLDKTGGLTEALALAREAQRSGFRLMVGCMAGTSLSMAPAFVLSVLCEYRDLDGALLLGKDRDVKMKFCNGIIEPISTELWG